jgi:hypothetical protein
MKDDEIEKMCEELNQYAESDGNTLSDVCRMLTQLADYQRYVSDDFLESLHKEIKSQLTYYKNNYEIVNVERPISYIQHCVELRRKEKQIK